MAPTRRPLTPPAVKETKGPGVIPGERRVTYESLLNKPGTGTATLPVTGLAGQTSTTRKFLRSVGTGSVAGAPTWDTLTAADVNPGAFPVGTYSFSSATVAAAITGAATTMRLLQFQTAGVARWHVGLAGAGAEAGADAGATISISAYTDAGVLIDNPLTISRAAGSALTLNRPVTINGALTVTGTIGGPGSGLTALNATNLASGTVASARLTGSYAISVTGSSASCTGNAASATTASAVNGQVQLDNAYVAGVVVPTGTVTLKDSTGTTYRIPCLV